MPPRGLNALMPQEVLVDEEGNVRYAQRLTGRFGAPTNLRDFPFDSHTICRAHLVEYSLDSVQAIVDCAKKVVFFFLDHIRNSIHSFGQFGISLRHQLDNLRH